MTEHLHETGKASPETAPETSTSDRAWLDTIRRELDPGARSANERAAFRMRIDEEIESRRSGAGWSKAAMAAAALAVALLWFAMPSSLGDPADRPEEASAAAGNSGLLSYAYYESDYLPSGESESSILSDEYEAIASAFDVP